MSTMVLIVWSKRLFRQNQNELLTLMVEDKDTGWRGLLSEKQGLHQEADILEKYGMDRETDLSELDQHDFSELESLGLKPLHARKLKRLCEAGCSACARHGNVAFLVNCPTTST